MFVDITTPKKPLEAEKLYNRCYRGGEEITPEICMEVLRSTNYAACIKRMLLCVEKLPKEKQAGFKEAVLSVFDHREQPGDVVEIGQKLAQSGGYELEFAPVAGKCSYGRGETFLASSAEMTRFECMSVKDFYLFAQWCRKNVYFAHLGDVDLRNFDLEGVEKIRFAGGGKIDMSGAKNLPEVIDLSGYDRVVLDECDLSTVKEIKLKEKAKLSLKFATNVPGGVEFSKCRDVKLYGAALSPRESLCFEGAERVSLRRMKDLPEVLDVSGCREIDLRECSLEGVKSLKFADEKQLKKSGLNVSLQESGKIKFAGNSRGRVFGAALKQWFSERE